jgi:hypothetical protein
MAWVRDYNGRYYWMNDDSSTCLYITQTATTTSSGTAGTMLYWASNTNATTSSYYNRPQYYYYDDRQSAWPARNPEAEQRALFERERARQAAMFEGHAEAASALADGLLMEHLTPEQRECYKQNKWFVVEGGKSKIKYRINAKDNLIANVDVLHGGERISHRLCAHADPKVMPLGDHLLAQKMMIEFAEENFLKVANRHAYH